MCVGVCVEKGQGDVLDGAEEEGGDDTRVGGAQHDGEPGGQVAPVHREPEPGLRSVRPALHQQVERVQGDEAAQYK